MGVINLRHTFVAALLLASTIANAQTVARGRENHPRLTTYKCTNRRGCVKQNSALVIDSLAHPIHQLNAPENCGNWGQKPNATACPDAETCQKNCILEPIPDYSQYGVTTRGDALTLTQLSKDRERVVSPRVYLLEENKKKYEMLHLTGNEFTFDVDLSKLPCGMNGALYLSEMEADGGKKTEKLNKAGAEFGTGYCDAQCYTTPFINGAPNMEGKGSCCNELDIWEANRAATVLAPHTCGKPGLFKCEGVECAWEGDCDKWGCVYNPYKVGNPGYYGRGRDFTGVDTTRPFTVVTQFPTDPKTGKLAAYKRLYIQDGKIKQNAYVNATNNPPLEELNGKKNNMDEEYCKVAGGTQRYLDLGGTVGMGEAMSRGMVLVFSIWWDEGGYMQWLDGAAEGAGPCDATEGAPANIRLIESNPTVVYSNVKWGEIGSTFKVKGRGYAIGEEEE